MASSISVAALAMAIVGCSQPKPAVIASRVFPSVVLGRLGSDSAANPPVERDLLHQEPPPPLEPKTEEPQPREVLDPKPPAARKATLPDDVLLRLQESGRLAFARCFKKAYTADPSTNSFKVHVVVELGPEGAITSATGDATDPELAGCLTRATMRLSFPGWGEPVIVDLPLVYRVE